MCAWKSLQTLSLEKLPSTFVGTARKLPDLGNSEFPIESNFDWRMSKKNIFIYATQPTSTVFNSKSQVTALVIVRLC